MKAEHTVTLLARYLYPSQVLPIVPSLAVHDRNPHEVPYVAGSLGFDFVRLVEFTLANDEHFSKQIADLETYYWGQEISTLEVFDQDRVEKLGVNVDRFVLTSWGALVPLYSNDIAIPTPIAIELSADLRG